MAFAGRAVGGGGGEWQVNKRVAELTALTSVNLGHNMLSALPPMMSGVPCAEPHAPLLSDAQSDGPRRASVQVE